MADYDSEPEDLDYANDPEWADITPIPQDDGDNPLAQITYSYEYSLAMGYLRAVMADNEHSFRVLDLTADIISMNPAHYTVWGYRFKTLAQLDDSGLLGKDDDNDEKWSWRKELSWVHSIAKKYEKNYQIWHHRQCIIDKIGDSTGERERTEDMFRLDSKNYHVWTYRQWLVKRFGLFDDEELGFTETLLEEDVRNNSAWNHRFFVVFGGREEASIGEDVVRREVEFAKEAVITAPQNPSSWNYLKAVLRQGKIELATLKPFCEGFAPILSPDEIKSSHALDILSEIYDESGELDKAEKALELLASKFDPVRKNYWRYRRRLLGSKASTPAVSTPAVETAA